MGSLDLVAATVLAIAALRGLFLGLVREAFSLASLAAAFVAARAFGASAAEVLRPRLGDGLPEAALQAFGMALVGITVLIAVRLAGALVRRGVRAVGLGFVDRLGGTALGAAEGALLVALGLGIASAVAADHPALAGSRAFAAFRAARDALGAPEPDARDVAAPPRGPREAPTTPRRGS